MNRQNKRTLMVDLERGDIWSRDEGTRLTPSEIRVLALLRRREGRPVPSEILIADLNRDPTGCGGGSPRFHISNLRRKLGHDPECPVIVNRPQIGYYLMPGVLYFINEPGKV